MKRAKDVGRELLDLAGIEINGSRPFDIQVHDDRFYRRVLSQGTMGLGESYMDGWWDAKQLDELFTKLLEARLRERLRVTPAMMRILIAAKLFNRQKRGRRAKRNAEHHYNIGNDLYERMLDKRMIYTCAYWKNAKNLDEAQEAKLDLICRKLHLKKGMTLLDIGCGWGGFAQYAAEKYGVKVTGVTLSSEQYKLAKERTKGLPINFYLQDYRETKGKFDRVVSIGFLEAVGPKNFQELFDLCDKLLNDDGIMLHHTISGNKSVYETDPWIDKYIFPGGVIPSLKQICAAAEKDWIIEDVQNIGPDYSKTLMAWHANFVKHYPEIKDKYDQRFFRMWTFYLLSCAALFRVREMQLHQIVFRKARRSETYQAAR